MANAKKCDRCGRFYDFYEGIEFTAGANKYMYVILASAANERKFDMCPYCMQHVIYFLHNEAIDYFLQCRDCKHWGTRIDDTPCVRCKRVKPECDHDRFEYDEKKEGE